VDCFTICFAFVGFAASFTGGLSAGVSLLLALFLVFCGGCLVFCETSFGAIGVLFAVGGCRKALNNVLGSIFGKATTNNRLTRANTMRAANIFSKNSITMSP
jgi:hypothetical protein